MSKKLVNADVVLGRNTVLFESFTDPFVFIEIGIGGNHNIRNWGSKGGIIIYYSIMNNLYMSQFIIPKGIDTWFFDHDIDSGSKIYVRMFNNQIQVSPNSTGHSRIRGFIILN